MRLRNLVSVMTVAILGLSSAASASMIVYDDFPGTSLDTDKWNVVHGTVTVADSVATLYDANAWSGIVSTTTWEVGTSVQYDITSTPSGTPVYAAALVGPGADYAAQVRNDLGGNGFQLDVWAHSGASEYLSPATKAFTLQAGDTLRIDTAADHTALYKNGSLLFSTSIALTGDFDVRAYSAEAGTSIAYDRISVGTVPEPHTMLLLATGMIGLLAYAWRKRR